MHNRFSLVSDSYEPVCAIWGEVDAADGMSILEIFFAQKEFVTDHNACHEVGGIRKLERATSVTHVIDSRTCRLQHNVYLQANSVLNSTPVGLKIQALHIRLSTCTYKQSVASVLGVILIFLLLSFQSKLFVTL